ncbi:ABC transporter ATP-binding protein/permease, partial [Escherichia coli]|nr:ABC transporter ATP-binding protein/permease [Escherichia coli]
PVEVGVLYAFVNYLERFFQPVNEMMQRLSMYQQAMVASKRVFELTDEGEKAPSFMKDSQATIKRGMIEFRGVTFSYDGKTNVLSNISFLMKEGQTVALVG